MPVRAAVLRRLQSPSTERDAPAARELHSATAAATATPAAAAAPPAATARTAGRHAVYPLRQRSGFEQRRGVTDTRPLPAYTCTAIPCEQLLVSPEPELVTAHGQRNQRDGMEVDQIGLHHLFN